MATQPSEAPQNQESSVSSETLDLAGDLDLEAQLSRSESKDVEKPAPAHAPATLPADDPEIRQTVIYWTQTVTTVLCVWVLTLTYASTAYARVPIFFLNQFSLPNSLGFAAGPLLFGPASELYGRRAVYTISGLIYSAFSIGVAFAPNAASLLIFRFFVGFFGSASINNIPASIGDITTPHNRGVYSVAYAIMAFGGPALGPLISAFVQHDAGFRWNFRVMAIFSVVLSILVALVPETHGPTLLKRRIAKEGKSPPPLSFGKVVTVFKGALSRPMIYLFTEPVVMLISIYLSVLYGILYGFFEAFTVVFLEIRGFKTTSYGLTYIALGLGFLFAYFLLITTGQQLYVKSAKAAAAKGVPTPPEARLALAYFGAILCPISLFIFAWTAPFKSVHWIAEFLFSASVMLIFTGFVPYLIDCYQMTAASALAAGLASRALIGSVFPLFTLQMYHGLTVQGATSLFAGIACILAPLPFAFKAYGTRIRANSKYIVMGH
ncbi:major facilitator superfamily domain-containing protein [Mycena capillaripes]|nr:major facilitator superfamily domain-containing protein [Mycena capillaripes]